MTIPPNPSWILRILDGGNPKQYAIAAIAFAIGFYMGDNRRGRDYWRDLARSFPQEGSYTHRENHHHSHTDKEHERENHRRGYER